MAFGVARIEAGRFGECLARAGRIPGIQCGLSLVHGAPPSLAFGRLDSLEVRAAKGRAGAQIRGGNDEQWIGPGVARQANDAFKVESIVAEDRVSQSVIAFIGGRADTAIQHGGYLPPEHGAVGIAGSVEQAAKGGVDSSTSE